MIEEDPEINQLKEYLSQKGKELVVGWLTSARDEFAESDDRISADAGALLEMIMDGDLMVTTEVRDDGKVYVVSNRQEEKALRAVPIINIDPRLVECAVFGVYPDLDPREAAERVELTRFSFTGAIPEMFEHLDSVHKEAVQEGWRMVGVEEWSMFGGQSA